jgi:cell division protease FtsH
MVTEYGMSELGPVTYEQNQGSIFLGRDYLKDKNFSDQIALEIDKETRRIIEDCYKDATNCINENRDLLEQIAYYLKEIETLTKQDIDEINATGHLKWYDEQKALKEARDAKDSQTSENVENFESTTSTDTTVVSDETKESQ